MKWLRPWILWWQERDKVFCLVCTMAEQTERAQRRGYAFYAAMGRAKTRQQAMKFFHKHRRCAPHRW
jgi:hypothetical protein